MEPKDSDTGGLTRILRLARAFMESQALFSAVRLGVFEHLADEPVTARQLARALSLRQDALEGMVHVLASAGLIVVGGEGILSLSSEAERHLKRDSPESLVPYVHWKAEAFDHWGAAAEALRPHSGRPQVYPTYLYDHLEATGHYPLFHSALQAVEESVLPQLAKALRSHLCRPGCEVLDLGGGSGHVAKYLLDHFPTCTATVVERNTDAADELLKSAMSAARVSVHRGDFASADLPEADVVLLVHVLCDWSDQDVARLLRRTCQSIRPAGVLAIVEYVLDGQPLDRDMATLEFLHAMETPGRLRSPSWWTDTLCGLDLSLVGYECSNIQGQAIITAKRRPESLRLDS
jgi:SAM-dependent methyltransferase